MDNIDVPEIRMIAVENALAAKHYPLAEKLCIEALKKNLRGYFNKPSPWSYYLERLYAETANEEKLTEMVHYEAGAMVEAIEMIDRLSGMYQRRPEMIEELDGLKKKLSK